MKKLAFFVSVMALLFTTTTYAKPSTKSSNMMSLTTHDGKIIDINITKEGFQFKQFAGKTVLLDFFGPMCPPCMIELPHLIELQEKHKDELQIIAVQVQMPMEKKEIQEFVKKKNINYPVINLNDAWDIVSFIKANTNWGGQIPFMLMFDKDGNMKTTYIGIVSNSKIIEDMRK
jgi:thiol-disulfide isomerase/thioredoxin